MKLSASKFISLKEENKLFSTIAKSKEKSAIVDLMLFQLLSLTGLRISEALNLKWANIGEDYLTIVEQKNGTKNGTVIIGNKLLQLLAQFKELNPYSYSSYLFNSRRGQYSRTNAHENLKEWLRISGLRSDISCHNFRHTYATRCLAFRLQAFTYTSLKRAKTSSKKTFNSILGRFPPAFVSLLSRRPRKGPFLFP